MAKYTNLDRLYDNFDFSTPNVKVNMIRSSFFHYYFREKKYIVNWNKEKNLINFKFLKFNLALSPKIDEYIHKLFFDNLYSLKPILEDTIRDGWRWQLLSIKEYNVIVKFADFVNKMDHESKMSKKDLLLLEEAFLLIVSNNNYPKIIIEALSKILFAFKKNYFNDKTSVIDRIKEKIKKFFSFNGYNPSIYDIIAAMNMVKYKRFLIWSDLLRIRNKEVIKYDFYNCSKDTFNMIVMYIKNTLQEIQQLEYEAAKIEWLKEISIIDRNNPTILREYYEKLGHSWENDKKDILLILIYILKSITMDFEIILHRDWELMTLEEKSVSMKIVVSEELEEFLREIKIEYDFAKSRHSTISPKPITITQLIKWQKKKDKSLDKHFEYIYGRIAKVLLYLKKSALLLNDYINMKTSSNNAHLNFMIIKPSRWRGHSVYDVINYYINLSMKLCGFFNEITLTKEIEKESEIIKNLEDNKKKLMMISGGYKELIEEIEIEVTKEKIFNLNNGNGNE